MNPGKEPLLTLALSQPGHLAVTDWLALGLGPVAHSATPLKSHFPTSPALLPDPLL